jgi:hypothetical protein
MITLPVRCVLGASVGIKLVIQEVDSTLTDALVAP